MNFIASSSKNYSNTSTNSLLNPQHLHHHHPHPIQFSPRLELREHQQMAFTSPSSSTHPPNIDSINNFMRKYGNGAYDLADYDQTSLFLSEVPPNAGDPCASSCDHDNQPQSSSPVVAGRGPPTLDIFPPTPIHSGRVSSNLTSTPKCESIKKGQSSATGQDQNPDSKTLRRLAQNREAARKSRLRRKAYIEQLETSKIKLTQLEHELKKAKAERVILGGIGDMSSEAAAFNMDYAKWLEDYRLHMGRLQDAVETHLSDNEIRFYVDNCITHFDDLMRRKGLIVKADVFHIFSGMWKTPVERCFMWIGGFRPSELIKIIPSQIQPLTQQQYVGMLELEHAIVEAEERLSQDLMAASMEKLSNLEVIFHQADNLRLETIHRVHDLMTTRQASRSLMAISEYFHRLQSLSTVWVSRDQKPQKNQHPPIAISTRNLL